MDGKIDKKEYIDILKKNKKELKFKIDNLNKTYENISKLLKLVINDNLNYVFEIKHKLERIFYVLESIDSNIMSSPKEYFEKYQSIIKDDNYSEKALHIIYNYEELNLGKHISSKLSFEVIKSNKKDLGEDIYYTKFLAGDYLSVFYEFKRHDFKGLKELKNEVDKYLAKNEYIIKDNRVLEIEHPELSMFLEKDSCIYEIQILIK